MGVVHHPSAPSSNGEAALVRRVNAPDSDTALNELEEDTYSGEVFSLSGIVGVRVWI